MKRRLSLGFMLSMCAPLNALEVELSIHHYPVVIESGQSLDDAMLKAARSVPNLAASDLGHDHHAVSSYAASVALQSLDHHYDAQHQRCVLTDLTLTLDGEMVLPMLKKGSIDEKAFAKEYAALKAHELHHQSLWAQSLRDYEAKFRGLSLEDDEGCGALFHEINQEMSKTLRQIEAVNLAYDCDSYGVAFDLSFCERHSDDEGD
ncbi:DUF922 domain-containing protein [Wohlfahrtiimonas chitiniclastica]|uniref:DUF922 domain-containing protein n=1 Tax=Wohlfahrtiimonas chitiniclastica TaxID=400946 RepID=UPI0003660DCF|nr:DUF922 domain-containing protein [Wohlfahrtiimonas chitiniclastica]